MFRNELGHLEHVDPLFAPKNFFEVGIGEDIGTVVPGLMAPAVYNAIGKWIDELPITPDKVLKALGKI